MQLARMHMLLTLRCTYSCRKLQGSPLIPVRGILVAQGRRAHAVSNLHYTRRSLLPPSNFIFVSSGPQESLLDRIRSNQ